MRAIRLNHVAICAPDLEASVAFYCELFGMERVPAPRFPSQPVAWLRIGAQQLHLFERVGAPTYHHFAIDVDDFEAAYLKVHELEIRDDDTFMGGVFELPGGEVQMYLRDPAGNLIEVNWPDVSTLDRGVVTDIVRLEDLVPQDATAQSARLYPVSHDALKSERLGKG